PNPVGSGPFTQVKNFSAQSYDVAKNPNYWQKGKPAFDAIRFPSYNGNDSATTDLTAGKIDWAGLFIPQVQQVYDAKNPNFHHDYAGSVPVLLSLNDAKYPYSLPVLRKAISMVVNRQAMSASAEYGYAPASDLTGLNGQFAPWEDKSFAGRTATMNVAAAQKMLTSAGFKMSGGKLMDPKGAPVAFDINVVQGWNDWDAMTQIIAQNVKQLGITATPKPVQFADYFSRAQTGNFSATMSWSDAGATPYQFYRDLTSSATYQPLGKLASGNNWERYKTPALDQLFSKFETTTDAAQQHALVNQMQRIFVQELPSIPLLINPVWYEYNSTRFTGFPTEGNYYVNAAPYTTPDRLIVMTRLTPKGQ
ncbi:MAG: ABC transporter substrate-binding protein, partial [Chloroflexi bacterium]|nr:ABC transporter substrate-binding protein [Chloroflexota bacterium]